MVETAIDETKIEALVEQITFKFIRVEEATDTLQANMEEAALEMDIAKMDDLENQVIEVKTEARLVLTKLKKNLLNRNPLPLYNIIQYHHMYQ